MQKLVDRLAAQQADALQHARANLALRVRWHALRLVMRAAQEVADHRAAVAAARGGAPQHGETASCGGCDGNESHSMSRAVGADGSSSNGGTVCHGVRTAEAGHAQGDRRAPDEDDNLLAGIPHLAPGACLLELKGWAPACAARGSLWQKGRVRTHPHLLSRCMRAAWLRPALRMRQSAPNPHPHCVQHTRYAPPARPHAAHAACR